MKISVELLENPQSSFISDLVSMQKKLLPGYSWNPYNMIKIRFDKKGRPNIKILVGFCDGRLAGFLQASYIYYYNKAFINVDFVAVLPEYRKSGLGLVLLRYLKQLLLNPMQGYKYIGIVGLAEVESPLVPFSYKRLFLYTRLGAQIRRDVIYKTPDYPDAYVIFYPASESLSSISTIALAWQLWRISQYTIKQFKNFIANIDYKNVRTELSKYK